MKTSRAHLPKVDSRQALAGRFRADTMHLHTATERCEPLVICACRVPSMATPRPATARSVPMTATALRPADAPRLPGDAVSHACRSGAVERSAGQPERRRHAEAAERAPRTTPSRRPRRRRRLLGGRAVRIALRPQLGLLQDGQPRRRRSRAGRQPQVPRRLARLRRHRRGRVFVRRGRDGHWRGLGDPVRRAARRERRLPGAAVGAARRDEPRDRPRPRLADVGLHAAGRRARRRVPALLGRRARARAACARTRSRCA